MVRLHREGQGPGVRHRCGPEHVLYSTFDKRMDIRRLTVRPRGGIGVRHRAVRVSGFRFESDHPHQFHQRGHVHAPRICASNRQLHGIGRHGGIHHRQIRGGDAVGEHGHHLQRIRSETDRILQRRLRKRKVSHVGDRGEGRAGRHGVHARRRRIQGHRRHVWIREQLHIHRCKYGLFHSQVPHGDQMDVRTNGGREGHHHIHLQRTGAHAARILH